MVDGQDIDDALIRAARAGDETALSELLSRARADALLDGLDERAALTDAARRVAEHERRVLR